MKRILTFAAAALITSASAFAGWGTNGQYGNADPNSRPVGQSSTPSNHPASAPITTPFNPNSDLGNVPGSFQDKASKGQLGGISSKIGYNPNKPMHIPGQNQSTTSSSRPSRQRPTQTTSYPQYPNNTQGGYGQTTNSTWGGYGGNNGGFFGNDVTNRPRPTNNYPQQYPTNMNNYPQYPQHTQYPTNTSSGYPKGNSYPQQHSTSSNSGWGSYGGNSTAGSNWGPVSGGYGQASTSTSTWGGYGGQVNSQYGMFAR